MKKYMILFFIIPILCPSLLSQVAFENTRAAIVISKTSFVYHWGVTQMSAHGWGGVMNLAGIPYDCFFVEDFSEDMDLDKYDCLIFSQCTYLTNESYEILLSVLANYISDGGNIIIDGLIGYFDQDTKERNHSELNELLGIKYLGFYGETDFRIKVKTNDHFVTKNFSNGDFVTQHLAGGLNIQSFGNDGKVLLELTNEKESFPFLSIKKSSNNRIILINDFGTWSGVASFFRNVQPQVFYKNQIYNLLIESVYWTLYDSIEEPFPSLQLTNADLTAIVRLDADASGNLNAQIQTINYLINLANETGVVPVYAWVSSTAASAGWQDIAPLGKKLESVGGQIGTHSKFHNIDTNMNEQRWKEELDDAIHEIEFNMSDYGYDIGKVDCFINPGNTIHMSDYNQVAKRFKFYMTHGFEQDMPIGYGNFTWFNEDQKNFVVLENTPSPDYQWFYDPTWSYTTQQITAYEESIFDHMYQNIGRGVIFNQMWHDYSITSQPQYGDGRIINANNIAMYDAIKTKFMNNKIYSPEPEDLRYKLCIMAQSNYDWSVDSDEINIKLDISNVRLDSSFLYTGGMGIRINNSIKKINKVFINGEEHFAFNDQLVILPNLSGTTTNIKIILAHNEIIEPHLTYISNRLSTIEKNDDELQFTTLTKSKSKFSLKAPDGCLLLNTDEFNYSLSNPNEINGYVNSDRTITMKKIKLENFIITKSSITISDYSEKENEIVFKVMSSVSSDTTQIQFKSIKDIDQVLLDSKENQLGKEGNLYSALIDPFEGEKEFIIKFK
jgi:hypothetical protein